MSKQKNDLNIKLEAGFINKFGSIENFSGWAIFVNQFTNLIKDKLIVIVTNNEQQAMIIYNQMKLLSEQEVGYLRDKEILAYDLVSPQSQVTFSRIKLLNKLANQKQTGFLIVSINTILQRLSPKQFWHNCVFEMTKGQQLKMTEFCHHLTNIGYLKVNNIFSEGEYAIRGSIMDIYPIGSKLAIRLDFFDDEIDNLYEINLNSQKIVKSLDQFKIYANHEFPSAEINISQFIQRYKNRFPRADNFLLSELKNNIIPPGIEAFYPLFFEETICLFDLLEDSIFITENNSLLKKQIAKHAKLIHDRFESKKVDLNFPLLEPKELNIIDENEFFTKLKKFKRINLYSSYLAKYQNYKIKDIKNFIPINIKEQPKSLFDKILKTKTKILICAKAGGKFTILINYLDKLKVKYNKIEKYQNFFETDKLVNLIEYDLLKGFYDKNDNFLVINDSELFSQENNKNKVIKTKNFNLLKDLQPGDLVVHRDYGIGRYLGNEMREQTGQELLVIEYANKAKIYLAIQNIYLIYNYRSLEDYEPPLDDISSKRWHKKKEKVYRSVVDTASKLLAIYSKRQASSGFSFQNKIIEYQKFSQSFPFIETIDQKIAIDSVLSDMEKPIAMDRLICGDVGFGKTEVAIRAVFIAISNNKQVAILVPTTLLCEQFYERLTERFVDIPNAKISMLSRFQTKQESNSVIKQTEEGQVNIIIATHKLIKTKINFPALALLIIDEEHRFGVKQKETLKDRYPNIDIITMSATPIPRSLDMSLNGLRDLSLVTTPPKGRLAIKTFVCSADKKNLQEAISREINRGGQIFYVYNDVKKIEDTYIRLKNIFPEISLAIAHGQMKEKDLEQVMLDFYKRKYQILLCSTIVENGIDIQNVNTILIHDANNFGLSQLHQLRGRVGRSSRQAYCYLLIDEGIKLKKDAKRRINSIINNQELGSGFNLAMQDLEIRGAGDILGKNQSGHIRDVSYSVYMEMLQNALKNLRNGLMSNKFINENDVDLEVVLPIKCTINSSYVENTSERIILYSQISACKTNAELADLIYKIKEKYGNFDKDIDNLFKLAKIKLIAKKAHINRISFTHNKGKLSYKKDAKIKIDNLVKFLTSNKNFKLTPSNDLIVELTQNREHLLHFLENSLINLARLS